MRATTLVPAVVVAGYGALYGWAWHTALTVDPTAMTDGTELLGVVALTLPWCIVTAPLAVALPDAGFPVLSVACAGVNAAILWLATTALLRRLAAAWGDRGRAGGG